MPLKILVRFTDPHDTHILGLATHSLHYNFTQDSLLPIEHFHEKKATTR